MRHGADVDATNPRIAAEQAVLGSMLMSSAAIDEALAVLGPRDFYRPGHQIIAECVSTMHAAGQRADAITVADELAKRGKISKTGGAPYLHTLIASVTTPASVGHYAGIVREHADRQQIDEIAARMRQDVQIGISPADVIARAQRDLDAMSRVANKSAEKATLRGIPDYPVTSLVGPLADLVASTTLPAALVAGAGLGALAGVCGNADLVMPDESLVRPTLWIPLVAPRGSGKTPAMDKAFGKLRDLDAAAHGYYREELLTWNELQAKDRKGIDAPRDTTRRIDDATLEVVARFLDRGDGTAVVESDELSGWLQSIGQYKNASGGDKGRWLSMWSAQPWRYQRVGADRAGAVGIDMYIQRPVVAIVGGIQPHLHNLLGDADSGFRPRWLPHCAPLKKTEWAGRGSSRAETWETAIEKLYQLRAPRQWRLEGEALAIWRAQCLKWKTQARGSENASASAALDKSDIQSARIALVIAESMNPGAGGEIPLAAMECAVAITDYVMNCWRALPGHESFALSKRDEILNTKVDELANWLETRKEQKATRTQIKESAVGGVRTADDVSTLIAAYAKTYPGTVVDEKPPGGGRPGQVVYAPHRESLSVIAPSSVPVPRVSERSETRGTGEGMFSGAKPQVSESGGVSEHLLGNSVLGNSVLGNSGTDSDGMTSCAVCFEPLNPVLARSGETAHQACEP